MENCSLLKIQKGCPLQISWNGSEECLRKHEKKIFTALNNGEISWKRQDQKSPYPLHIRFRPKLVPYKDELIINPTEEPPSISSVAFFHVYFIYAESADEYRLKVRPEISEWFANLNIVENSQWFIIFDSTRAKDKKNRGHVMEKIKSDFAKFLNKIIEFTDQNEALSLEMVQNILCTTLDSFISSHEAYFSKLKTSYLTDESWNLANLINEQISICRIYWSLSLYENVLALLDELDVIITEILTKTSEKSENYPTWFSKLIKASFGEVCPFLRVFMYVDFVTDTLDITAMRTFVLAQQILCSFFAYNFRLKSLKYTITEDEKFQQLASNFASFIFRYILQCVHKVSDDIHVLKLPSSSPIFHQVWTVILSIDAFDLCDILCTLDTVDTGVVYFAQLVYHKCLSLSSIFEESKQNGYDKDPLVKWFDFVLNDSSSENLLTSNVIEFCKIIVDEEPSTFADYYKDELLKSLHVLEKHQWDKQADYARHLLVEFYRSSKDHQKVYEFLSELIKNLIKSCHKSEFLRQFCHTFLTDFKSNIDIAPLLFLDALLYLASNDSNEITEIFTETLSKIKNSEEKIQWFNFSTSKSLFPFRIRHVSPHFLDSVINTPVNLEARIEYTLPFVLTNCKIKFYFKKLSKSALDTGFNPTFASSLGSDDSTFRFACVSKGMLAKEVDLMTYLQSSIEKCDHHLILELENLPEEGITLEPGENTFKFQGDTSHIGSYMLNHVEIIAGNSLSFVMHYQQEIENQTSLENIFCSVGVKMPSITIVSPENDLFSGVAQKVSFKVRAGTMPIKEKSKLNISVFGKNEHLEFLNSDNSWTSETEISISTLASEESYVAAIFLCLAIDRMNYSANQAIKVQHKIQMKWLDQTWTFPLNFSPIMSVKTMTSLLEDKVLFEMDVQRCDSHSDVVVQPTRAEILQFNSVIKPPIEATLLNPKLEPIIENSSCRIIWQIPVTKIDKSIPIKHQIKLLYRVETYRSKEENVLSIPECAFERNYTFEEDLTFCINKAEYEVCAQILSEHPQTVLCRAESQCDLIISLRSLSHKPEVIIVVVEADPEYWQSVERYKIVNIKENGIGQTSFGIIPKQVGFLPYPSIYMHKSNADYNHEKDLIETELFGEKLTIFQRNQGKQIHVLGPMAHSEDAVSSHSTGSTSTKISLKATAKQKIQKLFE